MHSQDEFCRCQTTKGCGLTRAVVLVEVAMVERQYQVICGVAAGPRRLSGPHVSEREGDDSMGGQAVTDNEEILTDVCIVGAGPAGITIARELDNRGVRVCLLEAGGQNFERRFQRQSRGESEGYPIYRLDGSRVRALGGTLRHPRVSAGGLGRTSPRSDRLRDARRSARVRWPFDRKHLDPYYTRAESLCGIRPFDVATTVWSEQASADALSLKTSEIESTIFQFPTDRASTMLGRSFRRPPMCVCCWRRVRPRSRSTPPVGVWTASLRCAAAVTAS